MLRDIDALLARIDAEIAQPPLAPLDADPGRSTKSQMRMTITEDMIGPSRPDIVSVIAAEQKQQLHGFTIPRPPNAVVPQRRSWLGRLLFRRTP